MKKKQKKGYILISTIAILAVYCIYTVINLRIQIHDNELKNKRLNAQISKQQEINQELKSVFEGGVTEDRVRSAALNELSLGNGDERFFINIGGK